MEKNPPPPGFVQQPGFQAPPPPYEPHMGHHHHHQQQSFIPPDANVTVINPPIHFGPETQRVVCPYCHNNIVTRTEAEANSKTHCMALLICLFLCWPCAWMPYCIDSCQNINHYCPHCNAFLGTYGN